MPISFSHHDHKRCQKELLARAERICSAQGSKLTGQRRDILACVAQDHAAVGAYEIIDRMAKKGVRHAPVTIYRALDFLKSHGLVHKIESRNAFVACTCEHQGEAALLICQDCSHVEELDVGDIVAAVTQRAGNRGFAAMQTVIEVTGQCEACAGKR